ncbi:MAG: AhpC/TSA family protein [Muribaculaceae bacterium]|nr:AhpC/TSA family protein [Muribaculaceae bacterium]
MKNFSSYLLLAFCVALSSCTGSYSLKVHFPNHDFDGKKAYLTNYDTGDTIDSVTVLEKQLILDGNVDTAYFARLLFENNRLDFVIEEGDIEVEWGADLKISGTPLNEKFNGIVKQLDKYEQEWQKIALARQNNEITDDEALQREDNRKSDLLNTLYNYYLANKDNPLGEWAFTQYVVEGDFTPSELTLVLKKVPKQYLNLKRVKQAVNIADAREMTSEGKRFVDFSVKTSDGNVERLSQYVADGMNYTLLYFWASWCTSCQKEISSPLAYLYEIYKDDRLKIIGVAVWDEPSAAKKAIQELAIPWHVMIGDSKLSEPAELYGISGIPYAVLISPDGNIVARGLNGDALIKTVEMLLEGK